MNNGFALANPFHQGPTGDWQSLSQSVCELLGLTADGDSTKFLAIDDYQATRCGFAERMRLVQHRIKDGLKVSGRGIDNLEDLGGGGLLLQRLARLRDEAR